LAVALSYIEVRTSRKRVMTRARRDILVVVSIAAGKQAVLNQETSGDGALP